MDNKIEALHNFHDDDYAQQWADKFEPSKDRLALFELISSEIETLEQEDLQILELGIGPGYLGMFLLNRLPLVKYQGLDFSQPMLDIAKKRLCIHANRTSFLQADLTHPEWIERLANKPDIVVTTWALHDLLNGDNIALVYSTVYKILTNGGLVLNGDFIQPENSMIEYEGGRIRPSEHLVLLERAGFEETKCLAIFEDNIKNPTTANNYACFLGKKSE